jgi:hypothetical protein
MAEIQSDCFLRSDWATGSAITIATISSKNANGFRFGKFIGATIIVSG